jgi:ankyrin repeat protein
VVAADPGAFLPTALSDASATYLSTPTQSDGSPTGSIFDSIANCDVDQVIRHLERGVDIETRNNSGETPLIAAATLPQPKELVEQLVNLGADVNASDNQKQMALHKVCLCAESDQLIPTIQILIENDASVRAKRSSDGWQPIHCLASRKVHLTVLKFLVEEAGASIRATTKTGATILHIVARNNDDPEVTKYLLEQGVDAINEDSNSVSAWDEAVIRGNESVVQAFLDNSLNAREQVQLERALEKTKNFKIATLLKKWMKELMQKPDNGQQRNLLKAFKWFENGTLSRILKI